MSSTLEICHHPHVTVSMQVDESRPSRAGSKWVSFRFTFHRRNDPIITVSDLSRHEATYNKGVLVPCNPPKTRILMEQAITLGNLARLSTMDIQNAWTTSGENPCSLGIMGYSTQPAWCRIEDISSSLTSWYSLKLSSIPAHWCAWNWIPRLSGRVAAHAGNLVVPYTS